MKRKLSGDITGLTGVLKVRLKPFWLPGNCNLQWSYFLDITILCYVIINNDFNLLNKVDLILKFCVHANYCQRIFPSSWFSNYFLTFWYLCVSGLEEILKKTSGKYCVGDEVSELLTLLFLRTGNVDSDAHICGKCM